MAVDAARRAAHTGRCEQAATSARTARPATPRIAAEERAAQLLRQAGCDILARNFRCRMGELDIVARRGGLLIIAEVRLRSSGEFGGPGPASPPPSAPASCARRAFCWRRQPARSAAVRFDTLLLSSSDGPIEWIEGAF
jgi:putative endonuclease